MIIIATHMLFLQNKEIYGPANTVSTFFNKTRSDYIFIKHRIEGECLSRVEYYKRGTLQKVEEIGTMKVLPFGLRHLLELIISIKIILSQPGKQKLFIGTDPLNALSANVLKLVGRVEKTVFFSADFSLRRFSNALMSYIYILFDKAAMFGSDQTWSVSKRIVEYRKAKGLEDRKNKILPNAKFFDDIKRLPYEKINKHDLVLVSALRDGIAPFTLLIDSIDELHRSIHDVRFHIIGSGPQEKMLRDYVSKRNLGNCVKFYGALSHEDMFSILVKSAIGIAIFEKTDKRHFRYFSDSMRTRDYLASGLPVFFSGPSSIGSEIFERDAGRIVKLEKKVIVVTLQEVLTKQALYRKLRNNALALAKEYDTYTLLKKYLAFLD